MVSVGVEEELVEDILHVACVMHKWWHSLVSRPWNFCCHVSATPAKSTLASHTQPTPARITPCVLLKAIHAGVGWVWLARQLQKLHRRQRPESVAYLHAYRVLEFVLYFLQPQNQLVQVEPRL